MHIASVAGRGMLVAFCVVGGLATSVVAAQADQPWKVHGKLLGKAISPSDYEKSEDVSGIACSTTAGFPRLCLVADDETHRQFRRYCWARMSPRRLLSSTNSVRNSCRPL